jgi:hypothetical protein
MANISRRDFLKLAALSLPATALLKPFSNLGRSGAGDPSQPNIILLIFDAMTARNLSLYDYPRLTSPNFSRFADRCTVFHRYNSSGNYTIPGTSSLLTGMYPWTHRAINHSGLARLFPRIPGRRSFFLNLKGILTIFSPRPNSASFPRFLGITSPIQISLIAPWTNSCSKRRFPHLRWFSVPLRAPFSNGRRKIFPQRITRAAFHKQVPIRFILLSRMFWRNWSRCSALKNLPVSRMCIYSRRMAPIRRFVNFIRCSGTIIISRPPNRSINYPMDMMSEKSTLADYPMMNTLPPWTLSLVASLTGWRPPECSTTPT